MNNCNNKYNKSKEWWEYIIKMINLKYRMRDWKNKDYNKEWYKRM
jgi:hypothetical protein